MTRWGHGHSTVTGILIGLLATRHPLMLIGLGFLAGLLLDSAYSLVRALTWRIRRTPGHTRD